MSWSHFNQFNNFDNFNNFVGSSPGYIDFALQEPNSSNGGTSATTENTPVDLSTSVSSAAGDGYSEYYYQQYDNSGGYYYYNYTTPPNVYSFTFAATNSPDPANDVIYLNLANSSEFAISGNEVVLQSNSQVFATFSQSAGQLTVNINSAYAEQYSTISDLIHSVFYKNTSETPPASQQINFSIGASASSGTQSTITVDIAPNMPVLDSLVNATGAPGSDTTNHADVEVSGTADPGTTVQIYADGGSTSIGHGTTNQSGVFDIVTSALANGNHSLAAVATDSANVSSTASVAFPVRVDLATISETLPASLSGAENTAISLSGISVSDALNSSDTLTTVLTVSNGTIVVGTPGSAGVTDNGLSSVTLTGTAAAVNAALATTNYTGNINDYSGDTLTVTTTDPGGNTSGGETVPITVADTAVVSETLPASLSGAENTAISLSSITVSDTPNGSDTLTAVLKVLDGSITVGIPGSAGVTDNGSASVTLTGNEVAINAALATANYTGSTNFYGSDTLSMVATDPDGHTSGAQDVPITVTEDVSCFLAGTMVRTPSGEAAIETLSAGDLILTSDGRSMPIIWLGRQTVSMTFANPMRVLPIRIKAAALDDNVPDRDLLVSPDHAILVGDILIQAGALVNDLTIIRETDVPEVFVYYHIELDDHALIVTHNTPAETFVDNVDRLGFDNWAEHERSYPNGKPIVEMPYPRAKAYRQIPKSVRAAIAQRVAILGLGITKGVA